MHTLIKLPAFTHGLIGVRDTMFLRESCNILHAFQENERQLNHWEFRHRLLKRMKAGYDHARKSREILEYTMNLVDLYCYTLAFVL